MEQEQSSRQQTEHHTQNQGFAHGSFKEFKAIQINFKSPHIHTKKAIQYGNSSNCVYVCARRHGC